MSNSCIQLPPETIDDICSFVDSHADLVSLALTCHTWNSIIIPRHSEYRKVKITRIVKHPFLWAHLRRRLDLARNVRSIQLVEFRTPLSSPDRFPTTLFQQGTDDSVRFEKHNYAVRNLCVALAAMPNLQEFIWDNRLPPKYLIETAVFQALQSSGCALKHLQLSGWFAMLNDAASALSTLIGLESLVLEGIPWAEASVQPYLKKLMSFSPHLQCLKVPYHMQCLSECTFPRLLKLEFWTNSSITVSRQTIQACICFVERHPTIEELVLPPYIGAQPFKFDGLPMLKSLTAYHPIIDTVILATRHTFILEYISGLCASDRVLKCLENIKVNRDSLKTLVVDGFDDLASIAKLAEIFPRLESLYVPQHGAGGLTFGTEEWMQAVSKSHNLKAFLGGGWQWGTTGRSSLNATAMNDAILRFAEICPKLERLDHFYPALQGSCSKTISMTRSIEDGSVTWKTEDPIPRRV